MKKLLSLFIVSIILLSGCFAKYKMEVDLTDDEINEIKANIVQIKEDIDNFEGLEGQIAADEIVALARAYEDIGELGRAIKVYKDVLDNGDSTLAIVNNLGKLYEKVGEFDLAIEQYQVLIDKYYEMGYLKDITWAYIRAGNRKEAEKYFNAWQLEFRKTDETIQKAIKKLREEEKNNS